ncbi:MAG: hypothetical protein V5A72_01265, partial [Candidatus Nanohaloarchaea archaeon]
GLFLILNILENAVLVKTTGVSFIFQDYSVFTVPFAVSLFLLGLSRPDLGSSSRINLYGKYTLLGYIFHQITGGVLTGATIVVESIIGTEVMQSSLLNMVLTFLAYIITMESALYYKKDSSIDLEPIFRRWKNR